MRSKYADVAKRLAEEAVGYLCEGTDGETRAMHVYFLSRKILPILRKNYRQAGPAIRTRKVAP